jgi:hypothetical protein
MADKHIEKLARQVHALSDALVGVGKVEDLKELILRMRKPGWTTPAEVLFVGGIIDSMRTQINALGDLRGALLKGSRNVR